MAGRWSPPLLLALLFLSASLVFHTANSADVVDDLLKFKARLSDPTGALRSWTAGTAPCDKDVANWAGVICDRGRVAGLQLENMRLSGTLDLDALKGLPGFRTLSFMNNDFEGPMPDVAKIQGLKALYLSQNRFSGAIPADAFANMAWLKKIHLAHNQFSGPIPSSVADLPKLIDLVLNDNKFDGAIPDLRQAGLKRVVLANNNLEGSIPETLSKMAASAFAGNKGLCGAAVGTPCKDVNNPPSTPSSSTDPSPKSSSKSTPVLIGIVFAAVLIIVAVVFAVPRREPKNQVQLGRPTSPEKTKEYESYREDKVMDDGTASNEGSTRSRRAGEPPRLAFLKEDRERFELQDLLKSTAEVLGTANFGCTYKATMQTGTSVVVKRYKDMNRVGKGDFDEHMRRLGRLSHPNLLPLVAYYYRKEEKLLITDYISKWSLANILHGNRDASTPALSWPARLKIVKGVARGLAYLYDEVQILSVPHGHLKSSNVLLNDSFEPLLTDYALLPVMNQMHAAQHMVAFKSPEGKQHNKTSKKSDVWSLGVLILEVLTGKISATNLQQGQEGVDLPNWVRSVIKEQLTGQVFDGQMKKGSKEDQEEMFKLLQIALACCEPNVDKRWDITEAVEKIEELKASEVDSTADEELSVVII